VCAVTAAPALVVGPITICGACGASLIVDDGGIRRATAAETTALSVADLQTLRQARGKIARAGAR